MAKTGQLAHNDVVSDVQIGIPAAHQEGIEVKEGLSQGGIGVVGGFLDDDIPMLLPPPVPGLGMRAALGVKRQLDAHIVRGMHEAIEMSLGVFEMLRGGDGDGLFHADGMLFFHRQRAFLGN